MSWYLIFLKQKMTGEFTQPNERMLTLQPGDDEGYTHGISSRIQIPTHTQDTHIITVKTDHFTERDSFSYEFSTKGRPLYFYGSLGGKIQILNDQYLSIGASGQQNAWHKSSGALIDYEYITGNRGVLIDPALQFSVGLQDRGFIDRMLKQAPLKPRYLYLAVALDAGMSLGTEKSENYVEFNSELVAGVGPKSHNDQYRCQINLDREYQIGSNGGVTKTYTVKYSLNFPQASFYIMPIYFAERNKNLEFYPVQDLDETGFSFGTTLYL